MQNIRLIKRRDLEKQQEPAEQDVAVMPTSKTTVEVVKAWVNEHRHEQRSNARQMFDSLFAH